MITIFKINIFRMAVLTKEKLHGKYIPNNTLNYEKLLINLCKNTNGRYHFNMIVYRIVMKNKSSK